MRTKELEPGISQTRAGSERLWFEQQGATEEGQNAPRQLQKQT